MVKQLVLISLLIIGLCADVCGQDFIPGPSITCFPSQEKHSKPHGRIQRSQPVSQTKLRSVFYIDHEHLSSEAAVAALHAFGLWAVQLNTSIPIHVKIGWATFPNQALASAKVTRLYRNLENSEFHGAWHVVSLAEKLEGRDLNDRDEPDMIIEINEAINWYFGVDALPPPDQMDFVTVILHEIAHGLGFLSSAKVSDSVGYFDEQGYHLLFDEFIYNNDNTLLHTLPLYSAKLYNEFTSANLYFQNQTKNSRIKLNAPPEFEPLSSISHFDESTYRIGNENSLMTPSFEKGEAIHLLGPGLQAMLDWVGWTEKTISLNIFPNPSDGPVNFEAEGMEFKRLIILDSHGKKIKEVESCCNAQINITSSGLYIAIAETNQGSVTKKFIIR